jgi:KaiC/GvpD/RAD55 family RecA-like ATPase
MITHRPPSGKQGADDTDEFDQLLAVHEPIRAHRTGQSSGSGDAFERIVGYLKDLDRRVIMRGPNQAMAQCPGPMHNNGDRNPSLSISRGRGLALMNCWAGCEPQDVMAAMSKPMSDLFDNRRDMTWRYSDGREERKYYKGREKKFWQPGINNPTTVLYTMAEPDEQLDLIKKAVADSQTILLCEGGKDVDTIMTRYPGQVAVSAPQGAKSFHKCDVSPLYGAEVIAIVDKDPDGEGVWTPQVITKLEGKASSLDFMQARQGKDASDHINAGYTLGELLPWCPPEPPSGEQTTSEAAVDTTEDEEPASWARIDLASYLDGTYLPVKPNMFTRTDGVSLVYPGLLHSFHGESESCKSMIIQSLCAKLVNDGHKVLYLDFESDPAAVTDRLLQLGATAERILANFDYRRPEVDPLSTANEHRTWLELLRESYRLAVIDGVGDALGIFKFATKDNDDITAWMRLMPKKIAKRTGAAVLLVDQVTKDSDTRGRFAIGGQQKMAGLTGAAYTVEIAEPVGIGLRGVVVLRVGKDRPGYIRQHCGPMRKSDHTQEAARVTIDSTNGRPVVTIEPWRNHADPNASTSPFRPTAYMEKVSRALEAAGKPLSFNGINERVTGNQKRIREALDILIAEGYVSRIDGPNKSQMHTLIARYEQALDPQSDLYKPADTP